MIVVGKVPSKHDREKGIIFSGDSGRMLREICKRAGARPIFINACNAYGDVEPDIKNIKSCRESHLIPLLNEYAGIPVVALGKFGASAILGGKRNETNGAGQVLFLYGRNVLFTYHPAYYLYARDERVLDHIQIHIEAALRKVPEIEISSSVQGSLKSITIDVENDKPAFPWYDGGKTIIAGIKSFGELPYPHDLRDGPLSAELIKRLNNETEMVVGHNLMYDLIHFACLGITFDRARFHDTMIYQKMFGAPVLDNGLKFLAKQQLQAGPYEAKFHTQMHQNLSIHDMDVHELKIYNAWDLTYTENLKGLQTRDLPMFRKEMDYIRYVRDMILNGFYVNKEKLAGIHTRLAQDLLKAETGVRKLEGLGVDFNFDSPAQVKVLLESLVGHKVEDTGYETLASLKVENEIIPILLDIRSLEKDLGSAEEISGKEADGKKKGKVQRIADDGCVHSSYKVGGTETFRLSSSKPNMQNKNSELRAAFTSRYPGGMLIPADLKAQEYRIIAHITGEPKLIRAFKNEDDIHVMMYKTVMGQESKTKEERKLGKTFNYAVAYEVGFAHAHQLMNEIRPVGKEEAKKIYYSKLKYVYPYVNEWKEETRKELWARGKITNLFGRVRIFCDAELADKWGAEREAINWKVQSAGHEITELFIMEVVDRLAQVGLNRVLLVQEGHDSAVFDTPAEDIAQTRGIIEQVSQELNTLIHEAFGIRMRVPMLVEVGKAEKWWS
jgi:DNA polymerase-1